VANLLKVVPWPRYTVPDVLTPPAAPLPSGWVAVDEWASGTTRARRVHDPRNTPQPSDVPWERRAVVLFDAIAVRWPAIERWRMETTRPKRIVHDPRRTPQPSDVPWEWFAQREIARLMVAVDFWVRAQRTRIRTPKPVPWEPDEAWNPRTTPGTPWVPVQDWLGVRTSGARAERPFAGAAPVFFFTTPPPPSAAGTALWLRRRRRQMDEN
jgi:hypothetical protein